jgi:hypothetical protein
MKSYASWFFKREGNKGFYHGQIRSYKPNFREFEVRTWICTHEHATREQAIECAEGELRPAPTRWGM